MNFDLQLEDIEGLLGGCICDEAAYALGMNEGVTDGDIIFAEIDLPEGFEELHDDDCFMDVPPGKTYAAKLPNGSVVVVAQKDPEDGDDGMINWIKGKA